MAKKNPNGRAVWIERWLSTVTASSMTQRSLASVEVHGGVALLVKLAKKHGIHLLQLTNDEGSVLIAASRRPFRVLL